MIRNRFAKAAAEVITNANLLSQLKSVYGLLMPLSLGLKDGLPHPPGVGTCLISGKAQAERRGGGGIVWVVFGCSIFLSAFLLFMVEPLLGKYLTPWFGGGAGIWLTCLAFFQVVLFLGYAYAHVLQKFCFRRQILIHLSGLGLMVACFALLAWHWGGPLLPSAMNRMQPEADPTWQILGWLGLAVGLPFLLLSATSSLYQAWCSAVMPGTSPYGFYALSNVGSLLALVAYPIWVEPFLRLRVQAWVWSGGLIVFSVMGLWVAWRILSRGAPSTGSPISTTGLQGRGDATRGGSFSLWVALSTCSCLSLMATTSRLTQDVAPVPFLWMIPMAIYLGTYILCFAGLLHKLSLDLLTALLVLGAGLAVGLLDRLNGGPVPIMVQIAGYGITQCYLCLFCHSALYKSRPAPSLLTRYYMAISLGGVIGGLGSTLLLPRLFATPWEYPLSFMGSLVLAIFLVGQGRSVLTRWRWVLWTVILMLMCEFVMVMGIGASKDCVEHVRNFYGIMRVIREHRPQSPSVSYALRNGAILHGEQFSGAEWGKEPTTYYGRFSGVGLLLANHPNRVVHRPLKVGVVGLGVGTLAAYGQTGDTLRFYEINPEIIRLASRSPWFSYLSRCPARVEIVAGDARLSLETELRLGQAMSFDVLVIDAFSGDSIPVHLLTQEAFEMYLRHCTPEGVVAVHISNRYLDLVPVLAGMRDHFGLQWTIVDNVSKAPYCTSARWVLLSSSSVALEAVKPNGRDNSCRKTTALRLSRQWTDDYSDLFSILK